MAKSSVTSQNKASFLASCFIVFATLHAPCNAQKPELSGYIGGMPSLIVQQPESNKWWQMLIHNRLNFGWQPHEYLRIDVGMRNRFLAGSQAMLNPETIGHDLAWADMNWNIATGKHALLNTAFDRLNISFEKNNWKLQLGRQRINWGQTFVWNPNDIFNTYSFFDFDYPERPGCDAFRTTYYHNETSSSELAFSVNHNNKITAALLHRWNRKGVDYQIITGEHEGSDLMIGGALTGDLNGLNLRGELSYFHPILNLADTTGIIAVSVGADYIFANSLMLQGELLYNNVANSLSNNGLMGLYSAPLSAKHLSICNWNVFVQTSYPITPRLNTSLSSMYFIDMQSCYAGLSVDFSITNNMDFSFIAQHFFTLNSSKIETMRISLGFARIKYSF